MTFFGKAFEILDIGSCKNDATDLHCVRRTSLQPHLLLAQQVLILA